jgi:polyhydroxyalkanoate synthase
MTNAGNFDGAWQALLAQALAGSAGDVWPELQARWAERHAGLWAEHSGKGGAPTATPSRDRRFSDPAWGASPVHAYMAQAYLINAEMLAEAAKLLPAGNPQQQRQMQFMARQWIDAAAPSNFAATNPEFIEAALKSEGESIRRGIENLLTDLQRGHIAMTDEAAFEVGRNLATTPGQVIYENELIQLIQYAPTTAQVAQRPFLIVPPCINKFYILDLQPENSFVAHLVAQGHTVFLISWRNVQAAQGHFGWDDYLELGPLTALALARDITGCDEVNTLGFCVGGTILSSALTVAAARGEPPPTSLTLLTTLLDFSDTGEIGCLVDEQSVALRESTIGQGGLLRGTELATTFSALRANDLIWPYVVGNYLKGMTPPAFDILFWNSDSTNLPGPFLAWYLRHLYLENSLRVPGELAMCETTADLTRIKCPVYFFASREDHIVPWRSAYSGRALVGGESEFVLGASGHIAGVINPPAKGKRCFWTNPAASADPDAWLAGAKETPGSWWPHWYAWLQDKVGARRTAPKSVGNRRYRAIEPAPGRYVREKA